MAKTGAFLKSKGAASRASDATDVAARHFVYKLYDATNRELGAWQVLRGIGEGAATVARAVQRGWAIVRTDDGKKPQQKSASLTEEGRRLARRAAARFARDLGARQMSESS
jgi:hypothetical protein